MVVSHEKRIRELILPVADEIPFSNAGAIAVYSFGRAYAGLINDTDGYTHRYFASMINNHAFWSSIRKKMENITKENGNMIEVVVCRSGQALHNGDKQIPNQLDSSLTLAGIGQANHLGVIMKHNLSRDLPVVVVPIASYLNRSQHTALVCIESMARELEQEIVKPLSDLLEDFTTTSINREYNLRGLKEKNTNVEYKNKVEAIANSYKNSHQK